MNSWLYWYQKLCLQLSAAALLEVCVRFPQSAVRAKLPVIRMCGSCRAQLAVLQLDIDGEVRQLKLIEIQNNALIAFDDECQYVIDQQLKAKKL